MNQMIFDEIVQYFSLAQLHPANGNWLTMFDGLNLNTSYARKRDSGMLVIYVEGMGVWFDIPNETLANEIVQYMKIAELLLI